MGGTTIIEAIKTDLLRVSNVEAIVNPSNTALSGRGGVDGMIHQAAGSGLSEECKLLGGCQTGKAKITGAYQLPYKAIIHTVGPVWKGGKNREAELLASCYREALRVAEENHIRSLAFPSVSTGTYKYPIKEAARIAVRTVTEYCKDNPDAFDYICWALLVESTRSEYDREIRLYPLEQEEAIIQGPDGDALPIQYAYTIKDPSHLIQDKPGDSAQSVPKIGYDDIIDVEFDEKVPRAERLDYSIAAASGLISGTLSVIWSQSLNLENAHNWGTEKCNDIVVEIARRQGWEKSKKLDSKADELKDAILYLEKKYPLASDSAMSDMGGPLQHHLRDFAHHPTIVGLIFSILSQFTKKAFGTDTQGVFIVADLPANAVIGRNYEEKILFGTVFWAFHLISDMDGSSRNPGGGTGIPGPLLSLLKELSVLPVFRDITKTYKDSEITFSVWISKLFNGTYFRNDDNKPIRFDLRTEIGVGAHFARQTKPVVVNECIVRASYFLRQLTRELKEKHIESLADLDRVEVRNILPYKNRILTRMLTVSSGVFVLVNTSGTAVQAAVKAHGQKELMVKEFFLSLNYAGLVRFGIACVADAGNIAEDIKEAYTNYQKEEQRKRREHDAQVFTDYKFLSLSERKMKILYSLEDQLVRFDISQTKGLKQIENKKLWLNEWEDSLINGLSMTRDQLFILDEDLLYSCLLFEWQESPDHGWLYLLAMELALFKAYTPLGSDNDKLYRSLNETGNYIYNCFCKRQAFISENEIKNLSKSVTRYESILSGKTQKALVGLAGTAIVTAATGGLALTFAPEIAVMMAGNAVAGLYGAALTSASLAFVGGGALAVGGLGMAGGTAILTGGGALIGLAGSGTVSMMHVFSNVPEGYILAECAKILTICKTMLEEKDNDWRKHSWKIKMKLDQTVLTVDNDIRLAEMQTGDKDKTTIKKMKTGRKYMAKCSEELEKLLVS